MHAKYHNPRNRIGSKLAASDSFRLKVEYLTPFGISDKGQTPKFAPHVRYSDFPCCSCLHSTPFKRSAQPRICIVRMVKYPHESLTEKRRPALEKLTWRKKLFTERRIRRRTKCRVINDGRSPARLSRGILSDRWPRMSWRQSRLSSLSPTPCHKTSVPPSLRERLNTLNPKPSVKSYLELKNSDSRAAMPRKNGGVTFPRQAAKRAKVNREKKWFG